MKKNFRKLVLAVYLLGFGVSLKAQVTVTSTGGSPTGTYTTLNDAFAAINSGTHQDVIDINITANTTEPAVAIPLVSSGTGASLYSSITIHPTGDVTVNSAAAPTASRGIIEFQGADNVIIDGDDVGTAGTRNLTFQSAAVASTGIAVIRFASASATDGATNNTIRNCNIIGSRNGITSTTTNYGIYSGSSGTANTSTSGQSDNNDNLTIENNLITRAYWGIYCAGTTTNYMDNLIIRNNTIGTTVATDAVANRGIYIQNTQALTSPTASVAIIEGNNIQLTTSTSSTSDITAIEIANGNCGVEVRKNNVHDVYHPNTGGYGAYGIWVSGSTNNSAVNITNNFIYNISNYTWGSTTTTSDFNTGILISVGATGVTINHNSISLQVANSGSSSFHSACIYVGSSGATIAELQNNILVNTQGSGTGNFARAIFTNATSNISAGVVNGNNYYTPGTSGYIGRYNAIDQTSLTGWQTATSKDANSYNVDPLFTSTTDLHIPAATNSVLESGGVTIASITDDYDSDVRPGPVGSVNGGGTANDVGADEFDGTPLPSCSGTPASANSIALPTTVCSGIDFDLSLDMTYTELGYTYQWESSSDDITYAPISGATSATLTTNQTSDTYYHCIITCTNGGLSTTSTSVLVTMNPVTACYCTPTFPSNVEPITLVDFAGISNTTSEVVNGTPALEDFTAMTASVTEGATYPITLKGNTDGSWTDYFTVYIDFNQNGDFSDAGESFDIGTINNSTGVDAISATGNITIPFGATAGITRMRVLKLFGGYPASSCNTAGYGQAEDYSIDITAAVICSGTPTAGVITAPSSICSGVSFNLDLTGYSTDANITLQWESSPDGITYTPIGAATSASYSTSITSDTYFQCVVTCTSSGMSSTTTPVMVTISPISNCYCTVDYPSNVEPITLVDFAGINNTTSEVLNGTPAQEDFTSMTASVNLGQTYPITLKGNTDGNFTDYFTVFIDFNQNGDYTDVGESFDIGTIVNSTGIDAVSLMGNITIPMSATLGTTGLRVSKKWNAYPAACNTSGFGQTEDYTIEILPCVAPATITLSADDADGIICPGADVVFNGDAGYPYYDFQINSSSVQSGSSDNYSSATLADNDMVTLIAGYDATCATSSNTITITHYPAISATAVSSDASCSGISDGSIDLTVSGGTSPFVFDWDNDGTGDNDDTEDLSALGPNTYNVIVMDDNGCTAMTAATITELTVLSASSSVSDATCFGFSDGSIDMTYTGGTGPFTYDWDNDGTGDNDDTEDLTALPAGTYIGVFMDVNGCNISNTIVIGEPTEIVLTFNATDISCNGLTDGAIDLSVTGGAGSYSYDWDTDGLGDNDDTEDLSGLSAGNYTVLVTDGSLCSVLESVTIAEPAVISVAATATDISCNGLTDGLIDLTVTGGTMPYVYDWDNDGTGDNDDTEDLSGLSATTYSVTVTDVNGCPAATTSATVTEPTAITIGSSITDANCDNSSDGAIDITVTGGTGAYTFLWSNSATTEDVSAVMAGSYTIDVTDANGCTVSSSETVGFTNTSPTVTLTLTNDVACNTESTIMLSGESPTGGVWTGTGVTGTNFDPSVAGVGTHTIVYTFTDGNGCANSAMDDIQVDDCSGITENEENLFQVYPNPSMGMFTVSSEYSKGNITIRDAIGKVVYSAMFTTNNVAIDLTAVERGVYYITLETEEGNMIQKIIKN